MLDAVALQGTEVIGVTQLLAQLLEQRPVAVPAGDAELAVQVRAQVGLHPVVVEQGVVNVDEEDDGVVSHDGGALSRKRPLAA